MDEQNNDAYPMTRFLLRMTRTNYDAIKKESQRMGVSMTSLINVIVDNHVKSLNPDGK